VFPRRTKATPTDELAFVGEPPLLRPEADEVHVSVTFTWDRDEGERLARSWGRYYPKVRLGGPAFNDAGGEFVPGRYLKPGYVITSRGCPNGCSFCFVPRREGHLRELPITEGWDVCDNNLLACSRPHLDAVFEMLRGQKRAARLSGGLDVSRIDHRIVADLQSLRIDALWLAYDNPRSCFASQVADAICRLRQAGLTRDQVNCFVLIGYGTDTPAEAEARCLEVVEWGGLPFAMLYRNEEAKDHARDLEWRRLQSRWCRPARSKARARELGWRA